MTARAARSMAADEVESAALPAPIVRDPNPGALRAILHALYDAFGILVVALASP